MKAAVVKAAGEAPVYADFNRPDPRAGHRIVDVTASALSHVTRSKASGSHYSSKGTFPFVAGLDGAGRCENGQRVYFFWPQAPFGAMAQQCLVSEANCVRLPDTVDDVTAAAIAIPGMSSWAALVERARFVAGETVLINGATGTSGRLAVQIAKHLGAAKIIATGRNAAALASLEQAGADVVISLEQDADALSHAFQSQFHEGVDVVLDYVWGASALSLLIAAARTLAEDEPLRFVQIGAISGRRSSSARRRAALGADLAVGQRYRQPAFTARFAHDAAGVRCDRARGLGNRDRSCSSRGSGRALGSAQ
jgi:NADPH:quinone reductase-like Zn-dependent oxidoreductase